MSYKDGPMDWYLHRLTKAESLQRDILSGRYKLRPGTKVQIYRPKRREAVAPWFRDRVWQRSMCNNGVYDDLTRSLTYDNDACQVGKGTGRAIARTVIFLRQMYRTAGTNRCWGVHRDVRKYFPSTPHKEIRRLDREKIRDLAFLPYLDEIVYSIKDGRSREEIAADPFGARGTGLGSQINQLHQVALLDRIDHELKSFCRWHERYMDDTLVLDPHREVCVRAGEVTDRMLGELGLVGVDKAGVFRTDKGFYFLRHFFLLTGTGKVIVRLHPDALRNERKALRGLQGAVARGEKDMDYVRVHYQAFVAQTAYCTGDGALRSMDRFYTSLFRERPVYKKVRKRLNGD